MQIFRLSLVLSALLFAMPLVPACAADDLGLAALAKHMAGTYSSEQQAAEDPEFHHVRLAMVPIWEGSDEHQWLYVEQAMATTPERPYRQRVYRLQREGDGYTSVTLELPGDPLRFAGAADAPEMLADLRPEDLIERGGCTIYLRELEPGRYAGATRERECPSSLRGASYATSEVQIDAATLWSWDRGFDANGEQVWGSVKGPYRFQRLR